MITFSSLPDTAKVLELGGGENRHPRASVNVDVRAVEGVDFQADFNEPLPIQSDEWDVVLCQYVLEHLSFRKVPEFLKEVLRILKPGGVAVFSIPNTRAQLKWAAEHPEGWDGKDFHTSVSELLYGSQDYSDNTHKAYFDPDVCMDLFGRAGFHPITTMPYGERDTDLVVQAKKPTPNVVDYGAPRKGKLEPEDVHGVVKAIEDAESQTLFRLSREEMFDKEYFNGGGKVGGYAREGYRDFPAHEITARHVLDRRPESMLELGCARGYVLKRIQDAGIPAHGLEISKHCWLTRACDDVHLLDLCKAPWFEASPLPKFDLCFSIATLEHVPEEYVPAVIKEMARTCKRGLHGIDFGEHDDGFDKTHCTLRPREWWQQQFATYAPGWPVEIVDKEWLEQPHFPDARQWWEGVIRGDGKVKLNVGSFTSMFLHGWTNIDMADLGQWAAQQGYQFVRHDVRNGLPFSTGGVDLIYSSHFLEHLDYKEGLTFLRECRRVIKPDGALRIVVPDARLLAYYYCPPEGYEGPGLEEFDEINDGSAAARTQLAKLHALLQGTDHRAFYDAETLVGMLVEAGFVSGVSGFRKLPATGFYPTPGSDQAFGQILRETIDPFPCLSLYVDAVPDVG